ncbi:MAG TPA: fumarylacetoacetate hydrolase family protein [Ktedonosporobacter sp.]|nr:fumarylacetoacetate hydrolase family protein [Ktedonosporobacter sp.]
MQIIRYRSATGVVSTGLSDIGQLAEGFPTPTIALHDLLRLPGDELRTRIEGVTRLENQPSATLLAPIDGKTEVWAAGVTYQRSVEARVEESATPDIYTRVYDAKRPELFFKALPHRVAGPDEPIAIRADSDWNVPEPELVLAINIYGEIIGYTIGNDVSSRSIEGENPLYLPQAKVYTGSCALGPGITPAWEVADPYNLTISMTIERGGQKYWQGQTSTKYLKRRLPELVEYLFREDEFPSGVLLCTGTALVPEQPFTLVPGDVVGIAIDQLGSLRNAVVRGKQAYLTARAAL